MLLKPSKSSRVTQRVAINGGCNLTSKCLGADDKIAEQIQMPLPNSGTITATWLPRLRNDHSMFTSAFAGYEDPDGHFRFDNAHNRGILHMDADYKGNALTHEFGINLSALEMINRRRAPLIGLLQTLERNVSWRIPIWFYMPWSIWWDTYSDFVEKIRERKPSSINMTNFCETITAYVNLNPELAKPSITGVTSHTIEAIEEAVNSVTYMLNKKGAFEFRRVMLGTVLLLPFLMYAPPGSRIEGPSELVNTLIAS